MDDSSKQLRMAMRVAGILAVCAISSEFICGTGETIPRGLYWLTALVAAFTGGSDAVVSLVARVRGKPADGE
jgi:hypothetical protein